MYISALPLFESRITKQATIALAYEMEAKVNKFYDKFAKQFFNCIDHRFVIKGESVMQTGFWLAKKRYAMLKVYDLETRHDVDHKIKVTGLDVVRSSFPPAFQKFMKAVLHTILTKQPKATVDAMILEFRAHLKTLTYMDIANNTSIKNITKFNGMLPPNPKLGEFGKGTPAHVKAAITYNQLLRDLGLHLKYAPIRDGDKIKWVRLKDNEYGIDTIAVKTYDDPPEIEALVNTYMDHNRIFEDQMANKLEDFYAALQWGLIPVPLNPNVSSLFDYVDD